METKQTGWWFIILALLIVILLFMVNLPTGISRESLTGLYITFGALLVVTLLFYQLTVKAGSQELSIRYGIGLIRKSWQIKDIESIREVKNPVIYGWGIHFGVDTTIYNIRGFKAVEIKLKNRKRKIRIGTPEPGLLTDYIRRLIAKQS